MLFMVHEEQAPAGKLIWKKSLPAERAYSTATRPRCLYAGDGISVVIADRYVRINQVVERTRLPVKKTQQY